MIYRVGLCTIDTQKYEVRQGGQPIVIEPQVFDLLVLLLTNSDRIVTKDEIIESVWKGRIVSEAALSSRIAAARKVIRDDGKTQSLIRTVHRRGFRFVGRFSTEPSGKSAEAVEAALAEDRGELQQENTNRIADQQTEGAGPDVAAGERKQVTVLCADCKESLEAIAKRDPEEALKVLETVIKLMTQAVHRYEGTVNVVTSDGVVALFGVPVTHEDHAVRACHAALLIRDEIERHAKGPEPLGVTLKVRAGLNSGEIVTRPVAGDVHRAIGPTSYLAAQLVQSASSGTLLISRETARLAEGHIQVKPRPASKASGSDAAVFELLAVGAGRTRFDILASRGLTEFVGRDAEMEQLERVLAKVREGQGQVVTIIGEAGLGKSRLLHEFLRAQSASDGLVLETASVSYRKATSYQPLIRLLRAYFKIEINDDVTTMRDKIAGRLQILDAALAADLSALSALLDVPVNEPAWQSLDSSQRRQRTFEALKRLIHCESGRQPVVFAIEDLHWIDSETQAFLDTLIDSLSPVPILLILTYRPEYAHHWGGKSYYTQLRLDVLSAVTTDEFVRRLLGNDASLSSLKDLLPRQGNPLFLEESIRTLVETNLLAGERSSYRLVRPLQELGIPGTVQAILAARIDRLDVADKRLLQAASVIGTDIPYAILKAIAGLEEEELRRRLAGLQEAEFLYEARLFPDLWYVFKHALTHEVAYGSLLSEQRQMLHRKIVVVIERQYPERLAEYVERLAHHASRGEIWEKAVVYLRQAGAKAFTRSANREAAAYFEQALTALSHLPETPETLQQGVDIRLALRNALWPLGRFEPGFEHLDDAERIASELGDERRLGWIAAYKSEHTRQTGHAAKAPVFAERALTIADKLDDFQLRVAANYYLGTGCFVAGDYRRTDEFFSTILKLLEGERFRERCGLAGFPAVMSRMFWPLALAERGEFARGLDEATTGVRLAEKLNHPYSLICAMRAVGRVHGARGNFDQAIPVAERSVAMSRDRNLPQLFPEVADLLGHLYALSGRIPQATSLLEEALAALESMGMFQWRSSVLVHLGETYLLAGRPEEASATAQLALTLTRERGHRGYEAWALRLLGDIATHQGHSEVVTAEANYSGSLAIARELQMRPLAAHCFLGLSKLHRRRGESQKSQEHLSAGTRIYRDLDMQFWLSAAER